jgi:hypothetical protein
MVEGRFPTVFNDEAPLDFEQRCYPNASDIKVFRYRDSPPAYQIWGGFDGVKQLIEELGAPNHVNKIYCVRLSSAEEFFKAGSLPSKRFLNYSVERFGLRIEAFPEVESKGRVQPLIKDSTLYLTQPSYWYERSDYLIQVWRIRVFASPVDSIHTSLSNPLTSTKPLRMYFEECWHPNRGKARSLHWLKSRNSNSESDRFKEDALRILDGVKRKGRPPGTKKLIVPDEFIIRYEKACKEIKRTGQLNQDLVAYEMGISTSTLYRRLKDHHLSWRLKKST